MRYHEENRVEMVLGQTEEIFLSMFGVRDDWGVNTPSR
jgi:hypothetical protein